MLDPKKSRLLIRQHFEQVSTEQFAQNLKKHCPEVFTEQEKTQKPHTALNKR